MVKMDESWLELLDGEFEAPYMKRLRHFLACELAEGRTYFPAKERVFRAFELTPFPAVKTVILGQDPYHGYQQAMGLSFSVPEGTALPPSLRNIFAELESDLGLPRPVSGNLEPWAQQGVLLLNSVLTVRPGEAGSHAGQGWEQFTDKVISLLSRDREGLVFNLWGAYAQAKADLIDSSKHTVLMTAHPSPFSAHKGFFGSKPFSRTNEALAARGIAPVDWTLPT